MWCRVGRASQRLKTPRLCPFLTTVGSTSKSAKPSFRLASFNLVQLRSVSLSLGLGLIDRKTFGASLSGTWSEWGVCGQSKEYSEAVTASVGVREI